MKELAASHGGLWVRTHGDGPPRVVALHGFTQHGGMYQQLANLAGVGIAAPDLPGHGRSTIEPATMRAAVDSVTDLLETFEKPPLLLGYSQGGRVALQTALIHPNLIDSLALVATSPGLNERERTLRRVADEGLATRIVRIGTELFIDEWLANPFVATDHVAKQWRESDRAMRLENTAAGLAEALRGMGQASVANSIDRIAALPMPVAFIAGTRDERYCEHATVMAASRNERPVLIPDAGHNVVLEAPEALAQVVSDLLGIG